MPNLFRHPKGHVYTLHYLNLASGILKQVQDDWQGSQTCYLQNNILHYLPFCCNLSTSLSDFAIFRYFPTLF